MTLARSTSSSAPSTPAHTPSGPAPGSRVQLLPNGYARQRAALMPEGQPDFAAQEAALAPRPTKRGGAAEAAPVQKQDAGTTPVAGVCSEEDVSVSDSAGDAATPAPAPAAPAEKAELPDVGAFVIEFEKKTFPERELGPVKCTPELTGKLGATPQKKPGADPGKPAAKTTVGKDVGKYEMKKKLGTMPFTDAPVKLGSEVQITSKGPKVNLGVTTESKFAELSGWKLGPMEAGVKAFEWEAGKKPHLLFAELKLPLTAPPIVLDGYDVTLYLEAKIKIEPNWEKLIEKFLTTVGVEGLIAAGSVVAPLAIFAAGLVAWAKSGHEFDDFENRAQKARGVAKAAANLVVGKAFDADLRGAQERAGADENLGGIESSTLPRMLVALGAPAGAVAAKFAKDPGIRDVAYREAWAQAWPSLRAAGMEHFKDGLLTDYKWERSVIESYGTGPYAKGF